MFIPMAHASKVCKVTLEKEYLGSVISLSTVADLNFGNNKEGKVNVLSS